MVVKDGPEKKVQHVSDIIGDWGPPQLSVALFFIAMHFIGVFHNMSINFYTPSTKFWCKQNVSDYLSLPERDECYRFEDETQACTDFVYDTRVYKLTFINKFDLVCERSLFVPTTKSIYQIGYAISSVLTGILSDKKGRLFALKFTMILEIATALAQAVAPNIYMVLVARFLSGVATHGRYLSVTMLVMEVVGSKHRATVKTTVEIGWAVGCLFLPLVHYFVPNYVHVQYIIVIYQSLFIIWLWRLAESPRWLLTNDRIMEAEEALVMMASKQKLLSDHQIKSRIQSLKSHVEEEKKRNEGQSSASLFDVWRSPRLRIICFLMYYIWFACKFVYYGFSYNAGKFGKSLYWNMFIQGMAEFVVIIAVMFIVNKFSRKGLIVTMIFLGSAATFGIIPFTFMEEAGEPYKMGLSFFGKLFVGGVNGLLYLYAAELFPTSVRQVAVGSCSTFGRIGSIAAPYVDVIESVSHLSVMMGVLGGVCVLMGLAIMLLPETKGVDMPDTIADAERQFAARNSKRKQVTEVEMTKL